MCVITDPLYIILLSYENGKVVTRASTSLKARSGRAIPTKSLFAVNEQRTHLILQIYADFLFVVDFGRKESGRPLIKQVGVSKFDASNISEITFIDETTLVIKEDTYNNTL